MRLLDQVNHDFDTTHNGSRLKRINLLELVVTTEPLWGAEWRRMNDCIAKRFYDIKECFHGITCFVKGPLRRAGNKPWDFHNFLNEVHGAGLLRQHVSVSGRKVTHVLGLDVPPCNAIEIRLQEIECGYECHSAIEL